VVTKTNYTFSCVCNTFQRLPQWLQRTKVVIGSSALRVWTCIEQFTRLSKALASAGDMCRT